MSVTRPLSIARGLSSIAVRTPTLPPATHTQSYLIGESRMVLVEPATPFDEERRVLMDVVERRRSEGARLEALFVTHHHVDHVGALPYLSDKLGVPVWAHRATAERLDAAIVVDRTFEDGEVVDLGDHRFRVIHTPGHAPGHLCLQHVDARWMIAGDMVASVGTILVEKQDGDMRAYLASLERMRTFAPSMLLPAHGGPIVDADAKLSGYIEHRLMRESKVLAALESTGHPSSLEQLVPIAYADTPREVWPLALLALEAHLIKLESEGLAVARDGFWRSS